MHCVLMCVFWREALVSALDLSELVDEVVLRHLLVVVGTAWDTESKEQLLVGELDDERGVDEKVQRALASTVVFAGRNDAVQNDRVLRTASPHRHRSRTEANLEAVILVVTVPR